MSVQPDLYDEMQKKLREGLRLLEEASEQDRDRLGLALLKLHGALADCIRLELSRTAPHLRPAVQDASRTSWQDLVRYGQQYLEFSESDARLISDADRQQQHVARGGTYTKSRAELVDYAGFVERRCTAAGQTAGQPIRPDAPERRRPWYASNWLLIAYPTVFMIFLCIIGILAYSDTLLDFAKKTFEGRPFQPPTTATPGTLPTPTFAAANPNASCVIVWVEYPDDLGQKSRAWVYENLIGGPAKAAGLTPRVFYDQVVEHNPILEADDYEFMTGQTYLLPECQ
jgi:hypothetical protein